MNVRNKWQVGDSLLSIGLQVTQKQLFFSTWSLNNKAGWNWSKKKTKKNWTLHLSTQVVEIVFCFQRMCWTSAPTGDDGSHTEELILGRRDLSLIWLCFIKNDSNGSRLDGTRLFHANRTRNPNCLMMSLNFIFSATFPTQTHQQTHQVRILLRNSCQPGFHSEANFG